MAVTIATTGYGNQGRLNAWLPMVKVAGSNASRRHRRSGRFVQIVEVIPELAGGRERR